MIVESLKKVQAGRHLSEDEAFGTFREVMNGECVGEAVLAALLTAMQMNGPDAAEVTGAARAMRAVCLRTFLYVCLAVSDRRLSDQGSDLGRMV